MGCVCRERGRRGGWGGRATQERGLCASGENVNSGTWITKVLKLNSLLQTHSLRSGHDNVLHGEHQTVNLQLSATVSPHK